MFGVQASAGSVMAAQFVGAANNNGGAASQAVTFPGSPVATDFAIIMCWAGFSDTASISGGAGGWTKSTITWTNYGYYSSIFYKALASGDLAGVTVNNGGNSPIVVMVYRGPTTLAVKSTNTGATGSTLALTGFTKNASCKGVVTIVHDRDPVGGFSPPGTFTSRTISAYVFFAAGSADILTPANYTNGTTVTWTGFSTGTDQVGWLIELL